MAVERALRGDRRDASGHERLEASVVVNASNDPSSLPACVELPSAATKLAEIIVAGRSQDHRLERLCAELGVEHRPYEDGSLRPALAGPDLVALTEASCTVDPGWLDRLDPPFSDPLVMAVAGFTVAGQLETQAQVAYETARGLDRPARRAVIDGASDSLGAGFIRPASAAAGFGCGLNLILRHTVVEQYGLQIGSRPAIPAPTMHELGVFAGLLSAGYRIVVDRGTSCGAPLPTFAAGPYASGAERIRPLGGVCGRPRGDAGRLDGFRALAQVPFHSLPARDPFDAGAGQRCGHRPWPTASRSAHSAPPHGQGACERRSRSASAGQRPARSRCRCLRSLPRSPPKAVAVLDALASQTHRADRFEVVVVIDGSSDGSAAAALALATPYRLRVVEQRHRGVAAARNAAPRTPRHRC